MKDEMNKKYGFDAENFVIDHLNTIVFAVLVLGLAAYVFVNNPLFIFNIPLDIIKRVGAYIVIAIGVGGILMVGGADLSAGRVMGLCALISASLLQSVDTSTKIFPGMEPMSVATVFIIVLLIGAVISAVNGLIVSGLNAPTYIVTLGTQLAVYGGMLIFLNKGTNRGQNIAYLADSYRNFVTGSFGPVPRYVAFAAVITLVMWLIYTFTPLAKNMRAVGMDKAAAKASGINVMLTTVIPFAIAGMLYGYNGFVEAARIGGPGASAGSNAEIDAILACLIGGMSVKGGVGGVGGIIIGVILLQLLSICLQWLSVSANIVYIIKGLVLCLAVVIDMLRWKLRKAK